MQIQSFVSTTRTQRSLCAKNVVLFRNNNFCLPKGRFREQLVYDYHTVPCSGHLGKLKTRNHIELLYYWKDLRKDVKLYVNGCPTYQTIKSANHKPHGFLQQIPPADENRKQSRWISSRRYLRLGMEAVVS